MAGIARRARAARLLEHPYDRLRATDLPPETRAANFALLPGGQAVPEGFLRQDWRAEQRRWLLPRCLVAVATCDALVVDLDDDGAAEVVLFGAKRAVAFRQAAGGWSVLGLVANAECPGVRDDLRQGRFELAPPAMRELAVGAHRLRIDRRGCG